MKKITKLLLLSLNFILIPNLCFAIKNETYLICKKEDDNLKQNLQNFNNKKIKENLHKNFSFYFLNNGKYIETAVKITFDEVNYKISIEAGRSDTWSKFIGDNGMSFGIDVFGKSAPYKDIFKDFKLTATEISNKAKNIINKN